jgi:hypothetical protein
MKQFFLLRNNQQSGPHSEASLKAMGLLEMDLIWIEHESSSWEYAKDTEALKAFVKKENKTSKHKDLPANKTVFVSLPRDFNAKSSKKLQNEYAGFASDDIYEAADLTETNEPAKTGERIDGNPIWQKKVFRVNEAIRLAAVFAGLVLVAILVKKTADNVVTADDAITQTSTATIIPQNIPQEEVYQHALLTETVTPVVEKIPMHSVKPKDIRRQVKLRTSDFKTGVLGGIKGLELTVANLSPHFIDRIVVSVDILKKNGSVLETKKFELQSLKPDRTKNIEIPASRRGVKVRANIVSIYSKDYKAALKNV